MAKRTRSSASLKRSAPSRRPSKTKPIRLGVVGIGRGQSFMTPAAKSLGFELVAICDLWEEKLKEIGKRHNIATYTDYDKFLEHDLDAVVLANYFHQHAPFAIKALQAGKHVMSETTACKTLAEGVELCRTVEKSGKVYMLAENYPYSIFCQEMRRVYRTGELGQVLYADGEYNHPINPDSAYGRHLAPTADHWRNWMPSTYYCTHAMAPLMSMTDTMPTSVNAQAVPWPKDHQRLSISRNDSCAVILCKMDNQAIFKLFGVGSPGHSCWYRVHGTQGAMEVQRGHGYFGTQQVRVWHEPFNTPPGQMSDRVYVPQWPEHAEEANKAGHGGGDFWTNFHFIRGIRQIEPVYLNVYRAVAMSVIGAQAWRSVLDNGTPMPIPDFSDEVARQPYENDHFSPFPEDAGPGQPPPSITGYNEPSAALTKRYLKKVKQEQAAEVTAERERNAAR